VWNRQRTDFDLADPANTTLGHKQVHRWNLPGGWVISKHPAHAALVSSARQISSTPRTAPRRAAPPGPRHAGTCWPGCWGGTVLTYDPQDRTLRVGDPDTPSVIIGKNH